MERRWRARSQFQLLWGRRRVGKSALIRRFADGKDAIVFQAVAGTVTDQLDLLTRRILAWRSDPELEGSPLSNWARTFAFLERVGRERKASGDSVDMHALGQLRRVVARLPGADDDTRLAIFARHGFDERLRATADAEDILLFDIHDLYASG